MVKFFGFIAIILLGGCISQEQHLGQQVSERLLKRVVVGESSREDVQQALGSPSSRSSFGAEKWYYLSTERKRVAFLEPEVVSQKVIEISFDDSGYVSDRAEYTEEDMRDIVASSGKTETEGRSMNAVEQLLGNIGRFNSKEVQ